MSVNTATGTHIPKDATAFTFDAEVTSIFDNMAMRSLPLYAHIYDTITSVVRTLDIEAGDSVWDFGVSTGTGLKAARNGIHAPLVDFIGVDVSEPMLERAKQTHPWIITHKQDFITDPVLPFNQPIGQLGQDIAKPKVIIWGWTLQFLKDEELRKELLAQSYAALQPGGVLFLMEKWSHTGAGDVSGSGAEDIFQHNYMHWRLDNGYTAHEIRSKSAALKGSMWPWSRFDAVYALNRAGFKQSHIHGMSQMFNFGSLMAIK